jgi:putative peptide zinc metalloprotease protein
MSTTAEPPAPPVDEAAPAAALDRAEGVELLGDVQGSGYKEGAALVRRADGQMVHLGPLMYALLEAVDGKRDVNELASVLSERLGRGCDEEHVVGLAKKLAQQGLLAGTEENAPEKRNPLLALRWKVLVTNPRVTKWLTGPFTVLFRPFVMWPVLAAFLVVCWFVLIHKGVASATAEAFHSPGLLLLVFVLAIASAGFHELGHASACRYSGATPGGMGMGIYMVWPAFYTDVTDSYRLPRRDRLRVDLGGLYFNTVVAVVTMGVWLAWHVDALLLLIALQLLQMVKQLSPMIRADGYHILSDITGVPDLFAHMIPTLRRLIPGRREPSALTGRARLIVTLWVLAVVPVLLSLMIAAIVLLPRLMTTTWENGRALASGIPHEAGNGNIVATFALAVKLLALCLPVLGSILITQKVLRTLESKARAWSSGHPVRRVVLTGAVAVAACGCAYALWPAGQYQPIRAEEKGTLAAFRTLASSPVAVVHPNSRPAAVHLTPGTHLAVSMIPVGGATKAHPAMFVIEGNDGDPAIAILSDTSPDPSTAATADPTGQQSTSANTDASPTSAPVQAVAFPFKLPSAPVPGETQAVAVGTKDGGVKYDVAYSLVTITNGAPVTNKNSAYALASCKGCTTVAVSFQVVLIVGTSKTIAPINVAEALNGNCPACVTTAIADQIVVTLTSQPSDALVAQLNDALKQLDALQSLGANGTPAAVAAAVIAVQQEIDAELKDSGLLANAPAQTTTTPTTSTSTSTSTTPAATATTGTSTAATTTQAATTTAPSGSSTTTTAQSTTTSTTTTSATTTATTTSTDQTTTTSPTTTTTSP